MASKADRHAVIVSLDTGEDYQLLLAHTTEEARHFAANIVVSGWWRDTVWYPPSRIVCLRTEPLP